MREIKPYCTEGKDFRFHSYLKNCVCICWINKYWLMWVCVRVCVYTLCICAYVCVCMYTHSISEYPCYSLIRNFNVFFGGFPCSSVGKESACNAKTQVWFLGWEDPMGKEMATHSSILAWRIPWTEKPGGLQSMGPQELDTT